MSATAAIASKARVKSRLYPMQVPFGIPMAVPRMYYIEGTVLDLPPLQMRICTKYKSPDVVLSDDVPSYPGYPLRLVAKLLASGAAILLRR
jgi:hypothetical protein